MEFTTEKKLLQKIGKNGKVQFLDIIPYNMISRKILA